MAGRSAARSRPGRRAVLAPEPDGEEGYPGNLACTVTYWWTKDDVCRIEYEAATDKPTVVNLSNHTFFNLKGQHGGYVMDH